MTDNTLNPGSSALAKQIEYPQETASTGRIISPNDIGGRSAYEPVPAIPNPFGGTYGDRTGEFLPPLIPVGESSLPEEK